MKQFIKALVASILATLLICGIMGCSGSGFNPTFSDKAPQVQTSKN